MNIFFQSVFLKKATDIKTKNNLKVNSEGYVELLNDKAQLFYFGFITPLFLFLLLWPFIIIWVVLVLGM